MCVRTQLRRSNVLGIRLGVALACSVMCLAGAEGLAFTRQAGNNGVYSPGAPLDITISFTYSDAESIAALGLIETLPTGWTYVSVSGSNAPSVSSFDESTGKLEFGWISALNPPVSFSFTYRVNVPEAETGAKELRGHAIYRTSGPELSTPEVVTSINEAGEEGEGEGETTRTFSCNCMGLEYDLCDARCRVADLFVVGLSMMILLAGGLFWRP